MSFWKNTWHEHTVEDECRGLSARPHPALDTILKSEVVAGKMDGDRLLGVSSQEMSEGLRGGEGQRW